jgi:integrase/recombinase XerD
MRSLRKKMLEDLRIRNYSARTIDTYVRCVAQYAKHFGRSPDLLGPADIRAYQVYLMEGKKTSWSSFNQAVCALRFFYQVTLGRRQVVEHIPFPRKEKRLPVVLSVGELRKLFSSVGNLKYRTVLMTMYGCGLRVSEALNLRVGDIDSERMLVRVCHGKGKRDRNVALSTSLLDVLRLYWKTYRPRRHLFPGRGATPVSASTVQKACRQACRKAKLRKHVTTHTMRHCYATLRCPPSFGQFSAHPKLMVRCSATSFASLPFRSREVVTAASERRDGVDRSRLPGPLHSISILSRDFAP